MRHDEMSAKAALCHQLLPCRFSTAAQVRQRCACCAARRSRHRTSPKASNQQPLSSSAASRNECNLHPAPRCRHVLARADNSSGSGSQAQPALQQEGEITPPTGTQPADERETADCCPHLGCTRKTLRPVAPLCATCCRRHFLGRIAPCREAAADGGGISGGDGADAGARCGGQCPASGRQAFGGIPPRGAASRCLHTSATGRHTATGRLIKRLYCVPLLADESPLCRFCGSCHMRSRRSSMCGKRLAADVCGPS